MVKADDSMEIMIDLPYPPPTVPFRVGNLVEHVRTLPGRQILIGSQIVTYNNHTKKYSLDCWLRRLLQNSDTCRSVDSVVNAIVATGLFERVKIVDPLTHGTCKGLRLI